MDLFTDVIGVSFFTESNTDMSYLALFTAVKNLHENFISLLQYSKSIFLKITLIYFLCIRAELGRKIKFKGIN